MPLFKAKAPLKAFLESNFEQNATIGFVPTMGALHLGHLSLMKESLLKNDITVVSIFVNPTQFTNSEDLEKYPRTLDEDLKKITELCPDIVVYAPSIEDIYEGKPTLNVFDYDGLESRMEGKFRPGHFDGVGTIVKRLFDIVNPTNAYFGEKDFQQLLIIKKMVAKNNLTVNVIGCPIFREQNGLAMSSRNSLLSDKEKEEASLIYQVLMLSKEKFEKQSAFKTTNWVEKKFKKNPKISLEYFQIAKEETLEPCNIKNKSTKYRAFIAAFVNNVRLIDTISLN